MSTLRSRRKPRSKFCTAWSLDDSDDDDELYKMTRGFR